MCCLALYSESLKTPVINKQQQRPSLGNMSPECQRKEGGAVLLCNTDIITSEVKVSGVDPNTESLGVLYRKEKVIRFQILYLFCEPICISARHVCASCPWRPEEDARFPGTGVADASAVLTFLNNFSKNLSSIY